MPNNGWKILFGILSVIAAILIYSNASQQKEALPCNTAVSCDYPLPPFSNEN